MDIENYTVAQLCKAIARCEGWHVRHEAPKIWGKYRGGKKHGYYFHCKTNLRITVRAYNPFESEEFLRLIEKYQIQPDYSYGDDTRRKALEDIIRSKIRARHC